MLVGGVAALVADRFARGVTPVATLVVLAAVALALDAVDGQVARRTGTVSALGARFDMEVDAFLVLVLSIHVAVVVTPWALVIGGMRYAFVAASWVLPWLRGALPTRFSAKVVAAAAGDRARGRRGRGAAARRSRRCWSLALLAAVTWSFGQSVAWLWRARRGPAAPPGSRPSGSRCGRVRPSGRTERPGATTGHGATRPLRRPRSGPRPAGRRGRRSPCWPRWSSTSPSSSPREFDQLTPGRVRAHPGGGARRRRRSCSCCRGALRRVAAALGGAVLGVLTILKVLDMGFLSVLERPFDPVLDWALFGNAREFVDGLLRPGRGGRRRGRRRGRWRSPWSSS